jgi:ABC-type methionine transport system ATPase subunit
MQATRYFVSFPEALVTRPIVYELVKQFDVVPNIRRANVEGSTGWIIMELGGPNEARDAALQYLRAEGCIVDDMTGDIVQG